jgi:hypothetical protein
VIDTDELLRMSPEERHELARALAAIDLPHPLLDPRMARRREIGLLVMMGACLLLAGWIAILMLTLPKHFTSSHWRGVWVGLDIAELAGFAATAWASWTQRQVVIFFMIFTGTLLIADAWFDLALDYGSPEFTMSLIAAVVAEIPLALLLFAGARRLVRITVEAVMRLEGITAPVPPLWRVPLFADGLLEVMPVRFRSRSTAGSASQPPGLSRLNSHGRQRLRRIPAAHVLDRLPDDRQRRRRGGHRAGGIPEGSRPQRGR